MVGPFRRGSEAGRAGRKIAGARRPASIRLLAVAAVAVGALVLGVSGGFGAIPGTPYDTQRVEAPEPQASSSFATRSVPADDVTGDGVNDVFVDSYQHDVYKGPGPGCGQTEPNGCEENAGKAYLVSGRDGSIRYDITSPELQAGAQFGFYVSVSGDANGDGKDDVVVGAESQDVDALTGDSCNPSPAQPNCNANQGKAYVFSGPTGRLIRTINNPNPQPNARFGSRLGRAGDIVKADGTAGTDGRPEMIMGASSNDLPAGCGNQTPVPAGCRKDEGEAFIFNGATGAVVRTLNIPDADRAPVPCTSSCGSFGLAVGGPGDTDGDGVPDQLVNAATGGPGVGTPAAPGRSYVFSGRTGSLLLKIDDPVPQAGALFGFDVVEPLTPGDVNGDGFADLFAYGFQQDGPNGESKGGRAWVFNGRTGAVLYELKDPTPGPGQSFGFAAAKTDYNKDGTPDIYVGSSPHGGGPDPSALDQNGETHIFDGRNGSLLKSLLLPEADRQPAAPGNSGPNLGIGVGAPGDLNGDGEPDYVAAAFLADADGNKNQGRLYFFRSKVSPSQNAPGGGAPGGGGSVPPKATVCANSAGVRVIGRTNSGGRVIQGTNGNNRICGTSAGDVITGNGGRDVISGGGGDDRINGGSGKDRVNGGSGKDLISGSSGNDSISGSSGNDRINGNSGKDRISGSSGNDRLNGSTGNDVVSGSSGKDVISGSSGSDRLSGNSGNDRINGNSGNDRISGGSGSDRLKGGSGNDRIDGGAGRDRISGGSGRNQIKQ